MAEWTRFQFLEAFQNMAMKLLLMNFKQLLMQRRRIVLEVLVLYQRLNTKYHWRLSYTNPPNFVRGLDNLEQFSYKNLQPPISLRLEMSPWIFSSISHLFDSQSPFWNHSAAAWLVQAAAAASCFTDPHKYFCFPDTFVHKLKMKRGFQ